MVMGVPPHLTPPPAKQIAVFDVEHTNICRVTHSCHQNQDEYRVNGASQIMDRGKPVCTLLVWGVAVAML